MLAKRTLLTIAIVGTMLGIGSSADAQTRLAIQGRLTLFNQPLLSAPLGGGLATPVTPVQPIATVGVRLMEGKLFAGLGLGFFGASSTQCQNATCTDKDEDSFTGWALTPLATFDLISGSDGALYVLAAINLGNVGGIEQTRIRMGSPTTTVQGNGMFVWGVNAAVGVRANLSDALSIGTEFGWGIASGSQGDNDNDVSFTAHGLFGAVVFEASTGI